MSYANYTLLNSLNGELLGSVVQEVEESFNNRKVASFDSPLLLTKCIGVLEQDTEPLTAPDVEMQFSCRSLWIKASAK